MRKFNFIINNFYSIFGEMAEVKKNIDSFIDDNIKISLKENVSSGFSYELMKRIEIEKEYAKEDVKTGRMVKYIIGGFILLLAVFTITFTLVLNTKEDGREAGYLSNSIDRFSNFVEHISLFTTKNLGFAFDFQTAIIIFLVMLCISLFAFADKIVFRKSYK